MSGGGCFSSKVTVRGHSFTVRGTIHPNTVSRWSYLSHGPAPGLQESGIAVPPPSLRLVGPALKQDPHNTTPQPPTLGGMLGSLTVKMQRLFSIRGLCSNEVTPALSV